MPTIYDIVDAPIIASYYNTMAQDRPPFLGEVLFPDRQKAGLDIAWIKGAANTPMVLRPSAFDVEVKNRPRIGFQKLETEMPFFKESKYIDEKTRQELIRVLESGNQFYIDEIQNRIFDDSTELIEAARTQRERLRMMALTTGMISVKDNGVSLDYDFQMPAENKITVTNKWDAPATSDPMRDIMDAQDVVELSGYSRPTNIIMNTVTWRMLFDSEKIMKSAFQFTNGVGFINDIDMTRYLQRQVGVTPMIYNKQYIAEDKKKYKYIPDGTAVLAPSGALGTTWFGTTPEEADLRTGSAANVSLVDTGVAVTTIKHSDPVNVLTKVSMVSLPSFEGADQVAILDVV